PFELLCPLPQPPLPPPLFPTRVPPPLYLHSFPTRRSSDLEYGILDDATGETVRCATEEEVYETLGLAWIPPELREGRGELEAALDRKSTRLNSSHVEISYAVFCLKKKKKESERRRREGEIE